LSVDAAGVAAGATSPTDEIRSPMVCFTRPPYGTSPQVHAVYSIMEHRPPDPRGQLPASRLPIIRVPPLASGAFARWSRTSAGIEMHFYPSNERLPDPGI